MLDHEARLQRLLHRQPDAAIVEPLAGRPTLIRRDQLLVADHDVPAVEESVRRWYDSREDYGRVSRVRFRAAARVDVCDLAHHIGESGGAASGDDRWQRPADRADRHPPRDTRPSSPRPGPASGPTSGPPPEGRSPASRPEPGTRDGVRHRRFTVAPNHLVFGQPMWWAGPAALPRPAAPPPPPAAAGMSARPVTIAVLDTGLAPHPWYDSTEWYARQGPGDAEVLDADLDYTLDAQTGHGTFIAGILLQHAPDARLRVRRVIGGDGVGDELDIVRGLRRLTGVDVVNLSIGCHTYDDRPSPVLSRAVAALGRATAVVACAGNAATDRPFWPAAMKPVIAVAALDTGQEDRAWFSNYGWWVDASAPGQDVTSSFPYFDGARPRVNGIDPDAFRGYATWSGTSFAAPVVAGAIADLAGREDLPASTAADLILDVTREQTLPDLGVAIGDAR
jgi:subtilisin family serine protease